MKHQKHTNKISEYNMLVISLIIIIILFQIYSFRYFTSEITNLKSHLSEKQNQDNQRFDFFENRVNKIEDDLENSISNIQEKINSTEKNLLEFQIDLKKEISSIKSKTSPDFSGIIEDSLESIVYIKTTWSSGTGFIISEDGYVVTNAHVLERARYANAITSDNEKKPMSLVGYDLDLDLALLKISGEYDPLEFGNSDDTKVGEKVIAIGNPQGLSFSVSEGIVSAVHRVSYGGGSYIQTDAALNPGNSGGPLINTEGKVIGINSLKYNAENIGFALESNLVKEWVNKASLEAYNKTLV